MFFGVPVVKEGRIGTAELPLRKGALLEEDIIYSTHLSLGKQERTHPLCVYQIEGLRAGTFTAEYCGRGAFSFNCVQSSLSVRCYSKTPVNSWSPPIVAGHISMRNQDIQLDTSISRPNQSSHGGWRVVFLSLISAATSSFLLRASTVIRG